VIRIWLIALLINKSQIVADQLEARISMKRLCSSEGDYDYARTCIPVSTHNISDTLTFYCELPNL